MRIDSSPRPVTTPVTPPTTAPTKNTAAVAQATTEPKQVKDGFDTASTKHANLQGLGGLSEKYEADGGPGTVSRDPGDAGGPSYGIYQLSTNTGSAKDFVNSLKTAHPDYYAKLSQSAPGSRAFDTAWKGLAKQDPQGFRAVQQDYYQKHFYEPGAANIKSVTGLDLSTRSRALNEVAWSTIVQHGYSTKGAADIFKQALHGRDPSQVSDAELINSIYAERGRTNSDGVLVHFRSSSRAEQRGVAARFPREAKDALNMLAKEQAGGSTSTGGTSSTGGTTAPTSSGETAAAALMKMGSEGAEVTDLQKQLQQAGFDPGGVDGKFGENTEKAVKAFQQAKGLDADGVAGPKTMAALKEANKPAPASGGTTKWTPAPSLADVAAGKAVLKQGMQGDAVKDLQKLLGLSGDDVDGKFGQQTKDAVAAFQKARGLTPPPGLEGSVGKTTLEQLKKAATEGGSGGGQVKLPLMRQGDSPNATVRDRGCGLTSVAMVVKGLTGKNVTPEGIYGQYGWYLRQGLTDNGVKLQEHSDLHSGDCSTEDKAWQVFQNATAKGHPIIFAANGPDFSHTGRGHIMAATGTSVVNGQRMFTFNDPATGTSRTLPFHNLWAASSHPDGNFIWECAK